MLKFTKKGKIEVRKNGTLLSSHTVDTEAYQAISSHSDTNGPAKYVVTYPTVEVDAMPVSVISKDTQAPTTPGNFTLTAPLTGGLRLAWIVSTDGPAAAVGGSGLGGYQIWRALWPGGVQGAFSLLTSIAIDQSTQYDDLVASGVKASYYLRAFDNAQNFSAPTATLTGTAADTVAPTAPVVTATAISAGAIQVALTTPATDAGSGVASYQVEYKRSVDAGWTIAAPAVLPGAFPYLVSGLGASTLYDTRALARDVAGNPSSYSPVSSATTQAGGSLTAYTTNFTTIQNPLSEGGVWQQLDATATAMKVVNKSGVNMCTGSQTSGTPPPYDDSQAVLVGMGDGTYHEISGTIRKDPSCPVSPNIEVELLLSWSHGAQRNTIYGPTQSDGYEINTNQNGDYLILGRWKGAEIGRASSQVPLANGDVLKATYKKNANGTATIAIYRNGTLIPMNIPNPYTDATPQPLGYPGIGGYRDVGIANDVFGFTAVSATSIDPAASTTLKLDSGTITVVAGQTGNIDTTTLAFQPVGLILLAKGKFYYRNAQYGSNPAFPNHDVSVNTLTNGFCHGAYDGTSQFCEGFGANAVDGRRDTGPFIDRIIGQGSQLNANVGANLSATGFLPNGFRLHIDVPLGVNEGPLTIQWWAVAGCNFKIFRTNSFPAATYNGLGPQGISLISGLPFQAKSFIFFPTRQNQSPLPSFLATGGMSVGFASNSGSLRQASIGSHSQYGGHNISYAHSGALCGPWQNSEDHAGMLGTITAFTPTGATANMEVCSDNSSTYDILGIAMDCPAYAGMASLNPSGGTITINGAPFDPLGGFFAAVPDVDYLTAIGTPEVGQYIPRIDYAKGGDANASVGFAVQSASGLKQGGISFFDKGAYSSGDYYTNPPNVVVNGRELSGNSGAIHDGNSLGFNDAVIKGQTRTTYETFAPNVVAAVSGFITGGVQLAQSAFNGRAGKLAYLLLGSPVTADVTAPSSPGPITFGSVTPNSIQFSFGPATDNVAVTGYEFSVNGGARINLGLNLSYTIGGAPPNTSHTIQVWAYDAAGNRSLVPSSGTRTTGSGTIPDTGLNANLRGTPLIAAGSEWGRDVSALPVHPLSAQFLTALGAQPFSLDGGGRFYNGDLVGIPFFVVDSSDTINFPSVPVVSVGYSDESEICWAPIPLRDDIIEGAVTSAKWPNEPSNTDRHCYVIDRYKLVIYELYRAYRRVDHWICTNMAVWSMTHGDAQRPYFLTSSDAAGLSGMAGLLLGYQVKNDAIDHAVRFTIQSQVSQFFAPPAAKANDFTFNANALPFGGRLRIKASLSEVAKPGGGAWSTNALRVIRACKKYGMINADVGLALSPQGDTGTPVAISNITRANPGVVTTSAPHGFATGDKVAFAAVGGMTELNYTYASPTEYTITILSSSTFSIGVNTSAYGAYTSGGVVANLWLTDNDWNQLRLLGTSDFEAVDTGATIYNQAGSEHGAGTKPAGSPPTAASLIISPSGDITLGTAVTVTPSYSGHILAHMAPIGGTQKSPTAATHTPARTEFYSIQVVNAQAYARKHAMVFVSDGPIRWSSYDRYVSPTGSTSNTGLSPASPWPISVLSDPAYAWAIGGAVVGMLDGPFDLSALTSTDYDYPLINVHNGINGKPTVIQSVNPRGAILRGFANTKALIGRRFKFASHVQLISLALETTAATSLVYFSGDDATGIVVADCAFSGLAAGGAGVKLRGSAPSYTGALLQANLITGGAGRNLCSLEGTRGVRLHQNLASGGASNSWEDYGNNTPPTVT